MFNESGDLTEYVGTIIDTTERKLAEEALKKAFAEINTLKDQLAQEKLYLEEEIRSERGFEEIIGESVELKRILKQVETVAPTDSTVLIEGETGTGKELHRAGNPQLKQPTRADLREDQLCGDSHGLAGSRVVRAREGRLHRGHRTEGWTF